MNAVHGALDKSRVVATRWALAGFAALALSLLGALLAVILNISLAAAIVFYAGLALALFLFFKPFHGLLLLLFVIPLQYLAKLTDDGSVTVAKVVMPLVFLVWISRYIIMRDLGFVRSFFCHMVTIAGILYVLGVLPSFVGARNLELAFGFFLVKLAPYFVLMVIIIDMVRSRTQLSQVYKTALLISLLIGFFGVYEFLSGQSIFQLFGMDYHLIAGAGGDAGGLVSTKYGASAMAGEADWWRVGSTFLDPDLFCAFIMLSAAFAFGIWAITTSVRWRLLASLYLLVSVVNIIATGSRTGLVGMAAIIFLALMFFRFPLRKTLLVTGIVAFMAAVPFLEDLSSAYRAGISVDALKEDWRWGFWTTGIAMVKDNPVVGVGIGNFTDAYWAYKTSPAKYSKAFMAHNILLQVQTETGAIGLLFFLLFIGAIVYTLLALWFRSDGDPYSRHMASSLLIAFVGFTPVALAHNVLDFEYMWVLFGIVVVLDRLRHDAAPPSGRGESRTPPEPATTTP